jgi:hypothetical protein
VVLRHGEAPQLTLVRPRKWDDPFENFLLSRPAKLSTGEPVSLEKQRARLFGQCWTTQKESDAMWRIYSPCKDGIKVQSTSRKLFDALIHRGERFGELRYFIGAVQYLSQGDLLGFFTDPANSRALLFDSTGKGTVRALLLKREEFRHEQEVRLIFQSSDGEIADDVVHSKIDPRTLFDAVELDPRLNPAKVQAVTHQLRNEGLCCSIIQSELYKLPLSTFVIDES